MINDRPLYINIDGKWIPVSECEPVLLNIDIPTEKDFYKIWPTVSLEKLLKEAIEKEDYEEATIINKVLKTKADNGIG